MGLMILSPDSKSTKLKLFAGSMALDGSNPTVLTLPFSNVTSVALTLAGSTTPGDSTRVLTYAVSGRTLSIYAWKAAVADPTLEASTGTETFSYVVVGY